MKVKECVNIERLVDLIVQTLAACSLECFDATFDIYFKDTYYAAKEV